MAEPLLVCNHPSCPGDDHNVLGQGNTRRGQIRCSRRSLPSPELSTHFFYVWPKFILAGFLFGVLFEFAYVQSIRLGMVPVVDEKPMERDERNSAQLETWTDVFFYEMSFLYSIVMVLLYLVILISHALNRKLNLSLPMRANLPIRAAANWCVGTVLGLSVVLAFMIGPKVMIEQRIWQALGSVVIGAVAVCFLLYFAAVDLQARLMSEDQPPYASVSSSCKDKAQQGTQSDIHDPMTIPLIEAHIV